MSYAVKEIFYSLQGEGGQSGRPAVFCRFAGCNLWSGREEDRATAICRFCDTDFVGVDGGDGGRFRTAEELAAAIGERWPDHLPPEVAEGEPRPARPLVIFTGGEPLLQLNDVLIRAVKSLGFEVAVETNGTIAAPAGIDWLCVSPKIGAPLLQRSGDELKLVFPQTGGEPEQFERLNFRHFFLQPMDGVDVARNTQLAMEYCLAHPRWRLSLQTHKLLGIR